MVAKQPNNNEDPEWAWVTWKIKFGTHVEVICSFGSTLEMCHWIALVVAMQEFVAKDFSTQFLLLSNQ